ncbi:MAG: hypothetical protein V2I43_16565 [Parvularcula sp.]|jgi:hypothetical protein|nr:hypothetical protein [Parvularcula sp.]
MNSVNSLFSARPTGRPASNQPALSGGRPGSGSLQSHWQERADQAAIALRTMTAIIQSGDGITPARSVNELIRTGTGSDIFNVRSDIAFIEAGGGGDRITVSGEGIAFIDAGDGDDEIEVLRPRLKLLDLSADEALASQSTGPFRLNLGGRAAPLRDDPRDWIDAGAGDDRIVVSNATVNTGAGDDHVVVDGSADIIKGDAGGSVSVYVAAGSAAVTGGAEDDSVTSAGWVTSFEAGDGDDRMTTDGFNSFDGGRGDDVVEAARFGVFEGGEGNDLLIVRRDQAGQAPMQGQILFGQGDGRDVIDIDDYTVRFGRVQIFEESGMSERDQVYATNLVLDGYGLEDIVTTRQGDDLIVGFQGSEDQITFKNFADDDHLILRTDGGEDLLRLDGSGRIEKAVGEASKLKRHYESSEHWLSVRETMSHLV